MIVRINIELRSILKIVLVLLFGIVCMFLNNNDVKALSSNIELDEQKKVIEETTRIFGNIDIESISYLYNLNDSPDYVFVDFKDSGYVIYYRYTLEIMEYSYSCNLEYSNDETIKCYAGPSNYYEKKNNQFVDVNTGYCLDISELDIERYASSLSTLFSKKANERSNCLIRINREYDDNYVVMPRNNNSPEIDPQHLIPANAPGSPNTTYIDNYDYFWLIRIMAIISMAHVVQLQHNCY